MAERKDEGQNDLKTIKEELQAMRQQISNLSTSDSTTSLTMSTSMISDLPGAEAYPMAASKTSGQPNFERGSIWDVDSASTANAMSSSINEVGFNQISLKTTSDKMEKLERMMQAMIAKMEQSETRYKMSEAKAEVLEANLRASDSNVKLLESNLKMFKGQLEQLETNQYAPNKENKQLVEDLEKTKLKLNYLATKHNGAESKIEILEQNTKAEIKKIQVSQGEIMKQGKAHSHPNNSQIEQLKESMQEIKTRLLNLEKQELQHINNAVEQKIKNVLDNQTESIKQKAPPKQVQIQASSSQIQQMKKEIQQIKSKQAEMEKKPETGKMQKEFETSLHDIKKDAEQVIKTKFDQLIECQAEKDKHKITCLKQVKSDIEDIKTKVRKLEKNKSEEVFQSSINNMQDGMFGLEKTSIMNETHKDGKTDEVTSQLESIKKQIKQTNLSTSKRIASVVKALPSRNMEQLTANEELHKASESGNLSGIWHAIELGADIECRMEHQKTSKGGDYLVHVPGNDQTGKGQSPLMVASINNHPSAVELLLRLGANVKVKSKTNFTPLWFAARQGYHNVVKTLLDYGACIEEADVDGTTLLMAASLHGRALTVKLLIEQGADTKKQNAMGETALFLAGRASNVARENRAAIVTLLEEHT